ncbi:MAG: precorrin-4 C(11)-methyltransferase [Candidatus Methylarchaceae archaeon HK02M1]|nr:precorrin-4 C(11)-methyltransferase [Candidatus Methylarchaceae archaeon HK02M1]
MNKIFFIGVGPGDPGLLTIKGKKILEEASVIIYAGSLVNPEILKFAKPGTEIYNSATMNLEDLMNLMIKSVQEGKLVARVHDGDPSIYGAIQEQIDHLMVNGIDCEIVPGVSSLFAASASLKRQLTLPSISQTVIITRPEGITPVPEKGIIRELAKHKATIAIFLGIKQIDSIVEDLLQGGLHKDTPVAAVYKASWPEEKIIEGNLENISKKVKEAGFEKTTLIIVGEVLKPKTYEFSKLYDPTFNHGYRKGR